MKRLITPSEVVTLAFGSPHTIEQGAIPPHAIEAAERNFLLPALGEEFYESLLAEESEAESVAFVEEYLKLPLALYVASRMVPVLAVKVGSAGVVRLAGESFEQVDGATLRRVVVRLRKDADTLLAGALEYLATHPELFPLYNPQNLTRHIVGGVVM